MRLSPKIHFVIVILLNLTWLVLIGVETQINSMPTYNSNSGYGRFWRLGSILLELWLSHSDSKLSVLFTYLNHLKKRNVITKSILKFDKVIQTAGLITRPVFPNHHPCWTILIVTTTSYPIDLHTCSFRNNIYHSGTHGYRRTVLVVVVHAWPCVWTMPCRHAMHTATRGYRRTFLRHVIFLYLS